MLCKMHNLTCIKPNILDTRDTRATNLYELLFFTVINEPTKQTVAESYKGLYNN